MRIYPLSVFIFSSVIAQVGKYFFEDAALLNTDVSILFSWIFLLVGVTVLLKSISQFRILKTTVHPFKRPATLITNGVFFFTRNPIYLGLVFILLAQAIFNNTLLSFSGVVIFYLVMNMYIIPKEEQILIDTFDNRYLSYKAKVGRWLKIK